MILVYYYYFLVVVMLQYECIASAVLLSTPSAAIPSSTIESQLGYGLAGDARSGSPSSPWKRLDCGVLDTENLFAYFSGSTVVCKFDLNSSSINATDNVSFVECAEGPSDEIDVQGFSSCAIHQKSLFGYFGTKRREPGLSAPTLCRFNLDPSNFSFDSCVTAGHEEVPPVRYPTQNFQAGVVLEESSMAFFAAPSAIASRSTGEASLCRFLISTSSNRNRFELADCRKQVSSDVYSFLQDAILDQQTSIMYFTFRTRSGGGGYAKMCKYETWKYLEDAAESCISPYSLYVVSSVALDTDHRCIYFATQSKIGQIDIGNGRFVFVQSISIPGDSSSPIGLFLDPISDIVILVSMSKKVFQVNLTSFDFFPVVDEFSSSTYLSSALWVQKGEIEVGGTVFLCGSSAQNGGQISQFQLVGSRSNNQLLLSANTTDGSAVSVNPPEKVVLSFSQLYNVIVSDSSEHTSIVLLSVFPAISWSPCVMMFDINALRVTKIFEDISIGSSAVVYSIESETFLTYQYVSGQKSLLSFNTTSMTLQITQDHGLIRQETGVLNSARNVVFFGGKGPNQRCYITSYAFDPIRLGGEKAFTNFNITTGICFTSSTIDQDHQLGYFVGGRSFCQVNLTTDVATVLQCRDVNKMTTTNSDHGCTFSSSVFHSSSSSLIIAGECANSFGTRFFDIVIIIQTVPSLVVAGKLSSSVTGGLRDPVPGNLWSSGLFVDQKQDVLFFVNPALVLAYDLNHSEVLASDRFTATHDMVNLKVSGTMNRLLVWSKKRLVAIDTTIRRCGDKKQQQHNHTINGTNNNINNFSSVPGTYCNLSSGIIRRLTIGFNNDTTPLYQPLANQTSALNCTTGALHPPYAATECIPCTAGMYVANGTCQNCPIGHRSDDGIVCRKCRAGSATLSWTGGSSPLTCTMCPANTFSDRSASYSCTHCPPDFSSPRLGSTSCRTLSQSMSFSSTESSLPTISQSLSFSRNESTSLSPSTSPTTTLSSSTSVSVSESVYCYNLDEIECGRIGLNNCHYCSDRRFCVPRTKNCECAQFPKELCDRDSSSSSFSSSFLLAPKGCRYCANAQVCVDEGIDVCECYAFGEEACNLSPSTCRWCLNFKSCLPLREECYCTALSATPCNLLSDNKCKYCADQQICLPAHDVNENKCSCLKMNSSNCQRSTCTWCSEYQTCSVPEWDCTCLSYSNDSTSCAVNSNNHCKYCSDEDVCVDTQKFTCRCENFTQSACDASSCKWCDDFNSCSVPQNTNCSCYYLRGQDSCSLNSNEKCKWCAQSSDTGKDSQNKLEDFNYCVNKEQDHCECSYLSPSFCSFSTTANASAMKFSSTCRFCEVDQVCAHPSNSECDCGKFLSSHACGLATTCSWKEPVLTIDDGSEYCSAAAACAPVTCAGILSPASCRNSGCEWDSTTARCTSSTCFNFFVTGFTPQPFLLYVIGLFKDVLVVFLLGAFSDYLNRPIMKFINAVKKKIKKQHHIRMRMNDTKYDVYMCDKVCRDGLRHITFAKYVEKVCESVFEFDSEELLDEKNRLLLFDAVAFALYDNMIWLDLEMMRTNTRSVASFSTLSQGGELYELEEVMMEATPPSASSTNEHEVRDTTNDDEDDGDDDDEGDVGVVVDGAASPSSPASDDGKNPVSAPAAKSTTSEIVEDFVAKILTNVKDFGLTEETDYNTRGQVLGHFLAAANKGYQDYLKTRNVDILKIKVFLSSADLDSPVKLRTIVEDALLARASDFVFYSNSRDRLVCGATGMNSFPTAVSLIYYSVALIVLFISSFITVVSFPRFQRMVETCDNSQLAAESSPSFNNNTSTNTSADTNVTTTTASPEQQLGSLTYDSSVLTGAYFLLGFRLLNASAFSTAVLVFIKTLRGIYQKYSGIYSLTLQERIPLMSLYSDRATHIVLFVYALLILPFALAGPFYGGFALSGHCWVPVAIGAAALLADAFVLYSSRRIRDHFGSDLLANHNGTQSTSNHQLAKAFGDAFIDENDDTLRDGAVKASSAQEKKEDRSKVVQENDLNTSLLSPRKGAEEEDHHDQQEQEQASLPDGRSSEAASAASPTIAVDTKVIEQQSSISSSSPIKIWNAIVVFTLTEEIPVIVISLALQLSFNYAAFLQYGTAFGIPEGDASAVYSRDYDSRSVDCIVKHFESDLSSFLSGLSAFVPFM